MIVLSEEEWCDLIESKTLVEETNNVYKYNGSTYDVANHSIYPGKNKENIKPVTDERTAVVKCENNLRQDSYLVVVSFSGRGVKDICFTSGSKVLMRNGEYKLVDDLKNNDLLMTSLPITELDHIAEIKNVYKTRVEDYTGDIFVAINLPNIENFEYNNIFIKTRY